MIVEVNGHAIDTDSVVIKANGKVVEITEKPHQLQTLTYDEGTSPSDGEDGCTPNNGDIRMKLRDFKHGTIVKVGKSTYRLYRLEEFPGGLLGTMKRFACLQPCALRADGHWWDDHHSSREIRNWSDDCELVDDSYTAVAGEVFDTRLATVK